MVEGSHARPPVYSLFKFVSLTPYFAANLDFKSVKDVRTSVLTGEGNVLHGRCLLGGFTLLSVSSLVQWNLDLKKMTKKGL